MIDIFELRAKISNSFLKCFCRVFCQSNETVNCHIYFFCRPPFFLTCLWFPVTRWGRVGGAALLTGPLQPGGHGIKLDFLTIWLSHLRGAYELTGVWLILPQPHQGNEYI